MKKNSIWGCIDTSKVESKPHKVLLAKPKFKYKFKKNYGSKKEHIIIRSRKKGIWHIPENF